MTCDVGSFRAPGQPIDEVQFLDDAIVGVCNDLADRGVRVSCRRCHEVPSAADEQISLVEG